MISTADQIGSQPATKAETACRTADSLSRIDTKSHGGVKSFAVHIIKTDGSM